MTMNDQQMLDDIHAHVQSVRAAWKDCPVKTLRSAWRQNGQAFTCAMRGLDFGMIEHTLWFRDHVLRYEFERRGYICADPNQGGLILDQPRKANA